MKPISIDIMDIDQFIVDRNLHEVTSTFLKETTTGNFDQEGLFSETIFGEIGSPHRITTHGFIELNTVVLHPMIFEIVKDMKSYYVDIMRGTQYAKWDTSISDLVKTDADDPKADTGYAFFMKYIDRIQWSESDSEIRKTRIKILKKNKKRWKVHRCIVIPAGLRDYREKNGRGEYDEINLSYRRILEMAATLKGSDTDSPIFDTVRWTVQRSVNEVFAYIWEMMSADNGFIQKKYGARSVARATRNVLVATEVTSTEDNPEARLKPDEVLLPLYQAIGAFMPLFKYYLTNIFFKPIFSPDSDQAGLIDPQTLGLKYVELTIEERQKFVASDKIESAIGAFRDEALRHLPAIAYGADKKQYYLYLVYRKDNNVYIGRNFKDMQALLKERGINDNLTPSDVRPMTWFEMYYHAGYVATQGKHVTVSRYPVTHHWSIFPAKVHLATTVGYSKVGVSVLSSETGATVYFPRWPDLDSSSIDGLSVHPSQLKILGGDHDGDMLNCIGIMSNEANQECKDYLTHPRSIVDPSGSPILGLSSDLCRVTMYNLTRRKK